jgi:hypothetical protein
MLLLRGIVAVVQKQTSCDNKKFKRIIKVFACLSVLRNFSLLEKSALFISKPKK